MIRTALADTTKRYGYALLLVGAAVVVTRLLDSQISPHTSPPYFLAVLFASILGGAGPGLVATVLASGALAYFDLGSTGRFDLGLDDVMRLGVFTVASMVISSVVAARRRAERELRRALQDLASIDRAKNEFIASVSHELRTPLASILGWSAILREDDLDASARAMAAQSIENSARTQAMLVDDLLDVSRIILGKLEVQREPVFLREIVEEAIQVIRPAAAEKSIDIETKFEGQLVARGDRHRLKQVVWNVLANAVKFTQPEGRIVVELRPDGQEADLRVRDTGIGIPADVLPYIFERFRQSEEGARRGGLGLGLAIARHIIELHNGSIEAASSGAGRGSTFTIRVPLLLATAPPIVASNAHASLPEH